MDRAILIQEIKDRANKGLADYLEAKKTIADLIKLEQLGKDKTPLAFANFEELKSYLAVLPDSGTLITKTGARFRLATEELETKLEHRDGLYLTAPHGLYIWDGRKKAIIKAKEFASHIDKFSYLLSGKLCYGVIKLGELKKISLGEFKKLETEHHISETERKKWWPNAKELFYYPVALIDKWKPARRWKVQKSPQTIVKDVELIDSENKKK